VGDRFNPWRKETLRKRGGEKNFSKGRENPPTLWMSAKRGRILIRYEVALSFPKKGLTLLGKKSLSANAE